MANKAPLCYRYTSHKEAKKMVRSKERPGGWVCPDQNCYSTFYLSPEDKVGIRVKSTYYPNMKFRNPLEGLSKTTFKELADATRRSPNKRRKRNAECLPAQDAKAPADRQL